MFDSKHFTNFAEDVANAQADATRRAELAELEAMTKGMQVAGGANAEEEGAVVEEVVEVDREQVEKSLTHVFSLLDDGRKGTLPAETMFRALTSTDVQVQSCQLSEPELRGLVAELVLDGNSEVAYKDHVQTWIPILFELRKSRIYEPYLQKDPFQHAPGLKSPDLTLFEEEFPLLPPEMIQLGGERKGSRRLSKGSKGSSKEYEETTVKRTRLRAGAANTRQVTRDSGIGSSVMGVVKMKRTSTMDPAGSKRNSKDRHDIIGVDGTVKRKPTLEGRASVSMEDEHPSGAGRGERRRAARGVIAPLPPRRNSKDRPGSKDAIARVGSKDGN